MSPLRVAAVVTVVWGCGAALVVAWFHAVTPHDDIDDQSAVEIYGTPRVLP